MDKRELINGIKNFSKLNYKAISVGPGSVMLVSEEVNRTTKIIFPYNKFPDVYILPEYVLGAIVFNDVEALIGKYYKKYKLGNSNESIMKMTTRVAKISHKKIGNIDDLLDIADDINRLIYHEVLPFFDSYVTINDLNESINVLPSSEIGRLICAPTSIRMLIIKRLSNAHDWERFAEETLEIYKEGSIGKHRNSYWPFYQFLPELIDELKAM